MVKSAKDNSSSLSCIIYIICSAILFCLLLVMIIVFMWQINSTQERILEELYRVREDQNVISLKQRLIGLTVPHHTPQRKT